MVNKKDLRAGVVKMREVAELLNGWADDMERSLDRKGRKAAADASGEAAVGPADGADAVTVVSAVPVADEAAPAAVPEIKYEDLRGLLAEKSAAGYRTQVIALIRSYGVEKLSEVDKSCYAELLEAVSGLGADAGGDDCAG